jgi:hypothetical protein
MDLLENKKKVAIYFPFFGGINFKNNDMYKFFTNRTAKELKIELS